MLQSNPHLVSPDGSFATFLATEDVEDDEDARAKLKHTVIAADYVRCGLVQTDRGYAQGQDPKRSDEHTSELQSLIRISYAGFCLHTYKIHKLKHISQTTHC